MIIIHFLKEKIKRLFLDQEQIALMQKLKETPGRIKVIGNGTIISDQDMLLKSENYKKTVQKTSLFFNNLKRRQNE